MIIFFNMSYALCVFQIKNNLNKRSDFEKPWGKCVNFFSVNICTLMAVYFFFVLK